MVRQTFSSRRGWRIGLAAAAVLAAGVGVLTVSGTASAGHGEKQVVITMAQDGQRTYSTVVMCGTNHAELGECVNMTYNGGSSFIAPDRWFQGPVYISARRTDADAWITQTLNSCESHAGDWVFLEWWNPAAPCEEVTSEGMAPARYYPPAPLVEGVPLEPAEDGGSGE